MTGGLAPGVAAVVVLAVAPDDGDTTTVVRAILAAVLLGFCPAMEVSNRVRVGVLGVCGLAATGEEGTRKRETFIKAGLVMLRGAGLLGLLLPPG